MIKLTKKLLFKTSTKLARYFYDNKRLYQFIEKMENMFGEQFINKPSIRQYIASRVKTSWQRYKKLWKQ